MHPLDRPVWASLTGAHQAMSEGGALALRYAPEIHLFASAADDSAEALQALTDLLEPGERIFVLQVPQITVPPGLAVVRRASGVQMVATRALGGEAPPAAMTELGDADAAEMLALAQLTEPGPFLSRTHTMGRFVGVRIGGRLAAMAGERFRPPGHTEVSGVCTHPDVRGRGLARALSAVVAARIQQRGETPFLHAWKTNVAAITLYETLGFRLRTLVDVAILEKPSNGA